MLKGSISQGDNNKAFNTEALQRLCNGDIKFMKELIHIFIHETGETIAQMESNVKNGNYNLLARNAHKIVPSCRFAGAGNLAKLIKKTERTIVDQGDISIIPELVKKIKEEANKIITLLKTEILRAH